MVNTHQYDILRGTWIYQEIKQQVEDDIKSTQYREYQQLLREIVAERFPRLLSLVEQILDRPDVTQQLRDCLLQVGKARTEKEIRHYLIKMQHPT
ncbi:MAG TPA: hypothetical protein VL461_07810 [Dictyobacter sp.]|jgi:hypothetical protein|nr:hypothetical protein [Dictyobacter sp.]